MIQIMFLNGRAHLIRPAFDLLYVQCSNFRFITENQHNNLR